MRRSRRKISRRSFLIRSAAAAGVLTVGGAAGVDVATDRLNRIGRYDREALAALRRGRTTQLFERYPELRHAVPWRPIGTYSTRVEELPQLAGSTDIRLFVKRDDATSPLCGGNKVRKLEHFLAEAELAGRRTVLTLGGLGTNQGLATAVHGRRLGFDTHVVLFDQPVTPQVQRNVRGMLAADATLTYGGGTARALVAARRHYSAAEAAGSPPYFIPVGGSTALGAIAHVNAALELAEQVRTGLLPEPDRLFVALGTCGTAAGLALGCRIAGLRTRVTPVRVVAAVPANAWTAQMLANAAASFLHEHDRSFPRVRLGMNDFDVVGDQFGGGYGVPTEAGRAAAAWAAPRLTLDDTYTAKALAACLAYCRGRARPGETVLFWNTFSSAAVEEARTLDGLPAALRSIFDS